MPESTIAAGIARALMELAIRRGADRKELAARARIALEELDDQDNRIPFTKYVALMRAGQELCGDPALALHFGEAFDMSEMSIVGLIVAASATMEGMFAQLSRYERLVVDVEAEGGASHRLKLVRRKGRLWLFDTRRNPNEFPELTESTLARIVCQARRDPSGKPFIKEVHVTHKAPSYRAEYDRVFQLPVVFESDRNALLLDPSILTIKLPPANRYVFGVLSERAEALLERLERSKTTRGRVESLLLPILHSGDANMDEAARRLGVSRQTLFRRLKAESTTFEAVLDDLRHRMALNYLSGKKASVTQTAYLVGFSDPTAFSRAFKRWTGSSPREVRRTLARESGGER